MNSKKCSKCGKIKILEEFHRKKSGIYGRKSICKTCRSQIEYPNPKNIKWTEQEKELLTQNYHKINIYELAKIISKHSIASIRTQARKQGVNIPMHHLSHHHLYGTLERINSRCNNIKDKSFKDYGARGIEIADYWNFNKTARNIALKNFIEYAESLNRNEDLEIDRINNNGHYEKGNIRWVTRLDNANNKRSNRIIIYKGKNYTLAQLSRHEDCNVEYHTLYYRIIHAKQSVNTALKGVKYG